MVDKLERLGPASFFGRPGVRHARVVVPVGIAVTAYFTPDDGAVAAELIGDLSAAQTAIQPRMIVTRSS